MAGRPDPKRANQGNPETHMLEQIVHFVLITITFSKIVAGAQRWGLTPVILATWEAEIRSPAQANSL
jgi:hypothetical protein